MWDQSLTLVWIKNIYTKSKETLGATENDWMILEIFLTFVLASTIVFYVWKNFLARSKLAHIPGPRPWPIVGSLHQLGSLPHQTLKEWASKYGDVMKVQLGNQDAIVVSSMDAARESLITKAADFAGRSHSYVGGYATRNGKDIVYGDYNQQWKTLRTLTHKAVKVYGERKELLEGVIMGEANDLIKRFKETNGSPIWPQRNVDLSILNVIAAIVFGSRYSIEDMEFKEVRDFFDIIFQSLGPASVIDFLPWLKYINRGLMAPLTDAIRRRDAFISKKLKEHEDKLDLKKPNDFVDYLLVQKQENANGILTKDHYELAIIDIFAAGIETTATSLGWTLALLAKYPKTQEKAYQEIMKYISDERSPNLQDKENLHYVQAVIHESLRVYSPAPLNIPHRTTCDTSIKGIKIPKDTTVIYNLYSIGTDPNSWEDSTEYIPERWLDDQGVFNVSKNDSFMPFSSGHRVCIGTALAKAELFLFVTSLIQKFKINNISMEENIPITSSTGLTWRPDEYLVSFTER